MNIKDTIKALLQSKFGGVQLSAARIEALAKRMEGKVTTEEELSQKLEALNELHPFTEMRAEDDRQRSLQAELEKLKGKGTEDPDPKAKTEGKETAEDDIPAWAKTLIEGNKTLAETVKALKGEKEVNDRRSAVLAKLKDADESYSAKVLRDFGRMNFADDAAFEEYLADVEADYSTHVQAQAESKLGADAPFVGIADAKGHVSDAVVENIVNNL